MSREYWCRHYNGTQNKECRAGINYETLDVKRFKEWPCAGYSGIECPLFEGYTSEEIAAEEAETTRFLKAMEALENRNSDICPHCGTKIERMQQVGRCVYARPCNCRLWQGRIPNVWREQNQ